MFVDFFLVEVFLETFESIECIFTSTNVIEEGPSQDSGLRWTDMK